jgi:hypothetical protein
LTLSRLAFLSLIALCICAATARAYQYPTPLLADPAYTQCHKDTDCKVVHPACSAPITVNRRHFDQVDLWARRTARHQSCPALTALPKVVSNKCVKQRCTLELIQPAPPAPGPAVPPPAVVNKPADMHFCEKDADCTVVLGDCCVKNFVNTASAPDLAADIKEHERLATCFFPDRRHVKNLRCENHQCTADLEVPNEMPDPTHSTKDKCEQ